MTDFKERLEYLENTLVELYQENLQNHDGVYRYDYKSQNRDMINERIIRLLHERINLLETKGVNE